MDPATPLTLELKAATHALHRRAERAGIMPALLRGELAPARYTALLRSLHAIYCALEDGPALPLPTALLRRPGLEADLGALAGPQWIAVPPARTAAAYAHRLRALGTTSRRLAHVYVRYLGDLNGGRILRRLVASAYGSQALHFYDFGDDAAVPALAAAMRAQLDAVRLDDSERQQCVDEACWAFEAHVALFEELAAP